MAETKKKGAKKVATKTAAKKSTSVKKTATKTIAKKAPVKKEINAKEETKKLTSEAAFSVWVDIFILVLIVLMFAVILYGYIIAK